jgi:uncharacterized protein
LKLHLDQAGGQNVFSGYGEGYVAVNGARYDHSVVVTARDLIPDWPPQRFDTLTAGDFDGFPDLGIEIVLLGTGKRLRFPRPEVTRPLIEAGIGVEVMDVPAACRTYNILMGEGRKVAAALILE